MPDYGNVEVEMEVLKGKIVTKAENPVAEAPREVELFTAPVAVHRIKLSFGAVPVIQVVLSVICGVAMWHFLNNGGEMQSAAEAMLGRITGG